MRWTNWCRKKKDNMEVVIVTTIPTVTTTVPSTLAALVATTIPSTLVASAATAVPVATTLPTTSTTTSVTKSSTTSHPSDEAGKLIKAMQDMSIKTNEINRLKDQIKSLEDEKKLVQIMHKDETQKSNK